VDTWRYSEPIEGMRRRAVLLRRDQAAQPGGSRGFGGLGSCVRGTGSRRCGRRRHRRRRRRGARRYLWGGEGSAVVSTCMHRRRLRRRHLRHRRRRCLLLLLPRGMRQRAPWHR
jgi:hypothetical protein